MTEFQKDRVLKYPRANDVAKAFGISAKTIRKWGFNGTLPRYRVGHCTFYRWEDVETLLCKQRYVGKYRMPVPKL